MTSEWLQNDFRMTSGWLQDDFRMTSGWIRAIREHLQHLKSTQRAREQSDFIIPSEPKILRLVKTRLRFCILTFLKKIPGFIYRPEIEDEDEEERKRFDRHYVRVWRAAMWVFLISRMLQPIIMVISDKELRLKTKVFLGLVVEERRIGTTGNLTNKAKAWSYQDVLLSRALYWANHI